MSRHVHLMVLLFAFGWFVSVSFGAVAAREIRIGIEPQKEARRIPEDFLGFGYETSAVAQPGFFSGRNERMVRLYRNLGPHGLIRIGGNVSDHTRYDAAGVAVAQTERGVTVINRASLEGLGDFARATGWKIMWGLNLKTGTVEQAVEEAAAVARALGPQLQSFEIGNEVDLMLPYARDYAAYHADYARYKSAIRARLPHAVFSGPDSAGNWPIVEKFVTDEGGDLALVTHHYYRGGASDPKSTLAYLLTRDDRFDDRLAKLHALCADHGLTYRINEVNSFFGGGKPGVSDTFGSALWCLDYLFDVATHGGAGVNMETDVNQLGFISHYSPIVHDEHGVCSARPEYYAMLAFAIAGRGTLIAAPVEPGTLNLTAYATRAQGGAIWLTVINKECVSDADVEIALPPGAARASAYRLGAPALVAKSGVTLGRAAVAPDGTWPGGIADPVEIRAGFARLSVPRASAAMVLVETGPARHE